MLKYVDIYTKIIGEFIGMEKAYTEKIVVEGFKSYGTKRKETSIVEGFIAIAGQNCTR